MMQGDNYIFTYYQGIKNGTYIVGKWVKLLYEYLINGIEKKDFYFDNKKANDAIDWIETHCFHTEGPMAPNPLLLEVWQKALLSAIFGIVDENGVRQFREILLVVARKNGKSLLAAAIANYVFRLEGGYGSKVYCIAPKLEQADIIYNDIWQMITLDPEWQAEEEQKKLDEKNRKPWEEKETFRIRFQGHTIEFQSTRADVIEALYETNRYFQGRGLITFNEFLAYLGQDSVEGGDDRGWEAHVGEAVYGYIWIDFGLKQDEDDPWITDIYFAVYPHLFDEDEAYAEVEEGCQKWLTSGEEKKGGQNEPTGSCVYQQ